MNFTLGAPRSLNLLPADTHDTEKTNAWHWKQNTFCRGNDPALPSVCTCVYMCTGGVRYQLLCLVGHSSTFTHEIALTLIEPLSYKHPPHPRHPKVPLLLLPMDHFTTSMPPGRKRSSASTWEDVMSERKKATLPRRASESAQPWRVARGVFEKGLIWMV